MSKRALLVGINYRGTDNELSGCINDVHNAQAMLIARGYECTLVTEDTPVRPTRANILQAFAELVLSPAEQLYFHYSGHGSQVACVGGEESDGQDETLVPIDYEDAQLGGLITDDELRGILECLRPNQQLMCVMDCCHSGTAVDLAWTATASLLRLGRARYTLTRDPKLRETRGQVISLSGCRDSQTSADTREEDQAQGALTFAFLKCLPTSATISELLSAVQKLLKQRGYSQVPVLTSGRKISLDLPIKNII